MINTNNRNIQIFLIRLPKAQRDGADFDADINVHCTEEDKSDYMKKLGTVRLVCY